MLGIFLSAPALPTIQYFLGVQLGSYIYLDKFHAPPKTMELK
jgi:hypothetical protein